MLEQNFSSESIFIDENISVTIKKALKAAHESQQMLIICGTFFIMSEARATLGIIEPRDDRDTNER